MPVEIVLAAGTITLLGMTILTIAATVMVKAVLAVTNTGGTLPVNALLAIAEIIRAIRGNEKTTDHANHANNPKDTDTTHNDPTDPTDPTDKENHTHRQPQHQPPREDDST